MKFIIMTNLCIDINVVKELIDAKLIPTIIVTGNPFYCEKTSILKYIFKKTYAYIKYLINKDEFKRKYPAYFLANKYSIQTFPSPKVNSDEFAELIKKNDIDYIFTFSFRILKEKIFKAAKYGCINFHPSLLPMNRGASPSNWCIFKNQEKTGLTFHFINKAIDAGPIIEQYEFKLSGYETAKILNDYLLNMGAILLIKLIYKIKYGFKLELKSNFISNGSYEPTFKKENIIISESSFQEIESLLRASRAEDYTLKYELAGNMYGITNCVDVTSLNISIHKIPYLDYDNNIVIKTNDNRMILLITKAKE